MKHNNIPDNISVIGAGIMGVMSAYTLSKRFFDANITIYDTKGFPADNASFIAGGMIAPLSELDHMPEEYLEVGLKGLDIWENISEQTGNNFEFAQNGSLFIAHNEDHHMLQRFKSILPVNELWSNISAQEINKLEPSLGAKSFRSALHMHKEGHLNPKKVLQVLCDQIVNKKTQYIDINTEAQKSDWVIDCRGIEANDDIKDLRGIKGEVLVVHNPEFSLSRPVRLMHPRYPLYIVPRDDNMFLIGATIIESENDSVSLRSGMELMSALYSLHRSFGDAEIIEMRAGSRPTYPDNLPRINVEGNIIRCNGLYRHGFLLSPVMAQCACDLIAGIDNQFLPLFMKESNNEHHIKRQSAAI